MAIARDPAYQVRRVLWFAYGILALALLLFFASAVLIGRHDFGPIIRPPAAPSAHPTSPGTALNSAPPAATQPQGRGATPNGSATARRSLTMTGFARGEPPGDIEDDKATAGGSPTVGVGPSTGGTPTGSAGQSTSPTGILPVLPVATTVLPAPVLPTPILPTPPLH